jgi:hypothetical protein
VVKWAKTKAVSVNPISLIDAKSKGSQAGSYARFRPVHHAGVKGESSHIATASLNFSGKAAMFQGQIEMSAETGRLIARRPEDFK